MTRQGNNRTNPRGIEIDEFRFNRMRRLKNAISGSMRPFSPDISRGILDGEGSRLGSRFVTC